MLVFLGFRCYPLLRNLYFQTVYAFDITTYTYNKFYSDRRLDNLLLDLKLNELTSESLSNYRKQEIKSFCTFQVEDGVEKVNVARGYRCLAILNIKDNNPPNQINKFYQSIKNLSYSLDTTFTTDSYQDLGKAIISGFENEIGKKFSGLTEEDIIKIYFTVPDKSEIKFLHQLLQSGINQLMSRAEYRLALIDILGRATSLDSKEDVNFQSAVKRINKVITLLDIKQDNLLDIALVINEQYAKYAAVTISSALLNSDLNTMYKFHIIMDPKDPLSESSKKKMESMKYIRNYEIDFIYFPDNSSSRFLDKNKKFTLRYPKLSFYRLYLHEIFPDLDKILYIDSDMLVYRDLTSLKQINLENYIAAAVTDLHGGYGLPPRVTCARKIPNYYKNSGLILFNLKNMRKFNASDQMLRVLESSDCDFRFADQDLFNITFKDLIYNLPIRWNMISIFADTHPQFSYFIAHHASKLKPWRDEIRETYEKNPEKLSEDTKNYWRYYEISSD